MKNIWTYNSLLPEVKEENRMSIGEAQTPLVKSRFIGPALGLKNLYFKLENLNPTGSYKDRFAVTFVSQLRQKKSTYCIATSSGNTGAALAAYCAAANITCYLVIVDGAPLSKIQQMQLYGAKIITVEGFGIDACITKNVFNLLEEATNDKNISLPISAYCYCPEGMQGIETIAYEILDELEGYVDHIFSPSGGGGLTLAIAKGTLNYKKYSPSSCKVNCVQPEGNNTIAGPLRAGKNEAVALAASTTNVSGLQVPGILDGTATLIHCRETGGNGYVVNDDTIFNTQQVLAQKEGIFCEAAGATSVSAIAIALAQDEISSNETIVCVITGSGFKDMVNAVHRSPLSLSIPKYDIIKLSNFLSSIES